MSRGNVNKRLAGWSTWPDPLRTACELQQRLVEARKARAIPDVLLLCEHPHVITLGRNAKRHHLLQAITGSLK